jgi:hypothetical protein
MIRNLENNLGIPADILVQAYQLADDLDGGHSTELAKIQPQYGAVVPQN